MNRIKSLLAIIATTTLFFACSKENPEIRAVIADSKIVGSWRVTQCSQLTNNAWVENTDEIGDVWTFHSNGSFETDGHNQTSSSTFELTHTALTINIIEFDTSINSWTTQTTVYSYPTLGSYRMVLDKETELHYEFTRL